MPSRPGPGLPRPGTIPIEGHGEVTAAPDTAFVTSGVTTQGATAREALDANTAAMNELHRHAEGRRHRGARHPDLRLLGAARTTSIPTRATPTATRCRPRSTATPVYNTVTVRVRDLAKLGAVLDQVVTVGANTINGVTLLGRRSVQALRRSPQGLRRRPRQGRLYADAAGVELEPYPLDHRDPDLRSAAPALPDARIAARSGRVAPVPVEAGELTFAINVSVTWDTRLILAEPPAWPGCRCGRVFFQSPMT